MRLFVAAIACIFAACNSSTAPNGDGTGPGPVVVKLAADTNSITPGGSITFEVTVTNIGSTPVTYGRGSSSCRENLVLIDDGVEYMMISRICTADLVDYSLDPGEKRIFTWEWHGTVIDDGEERELGPGIYHVAGIAGDHRTDPLRITVGIWP